MFSNPDRYTIRTLGWKELVNLFSEIPLSRLSDDLCVYQTLSYLSITGKGKRISPSSLWNLRGVVEENIVQYDDGKLCAIAALLVNTHKREVVFRGHYTLAGQLGFIHTKDWSYEGFCHLIETIQSRYSNYPIRLDRIKQDTLCWKYLMEYIGKDDFRIRPSTCVSICISDGYDAWYATLSKNTKQNIRTSYNRLNHANIRMQMKVTRGGREQTTTNWKRILLHSKRTLIKNNFKSSGILFKLLVFAQAINEYADPMTRALNQMEQSLTAEVFFDGKSVAFLRGFISEGNRLLIPLLTMDTEFSFYSPGGILINETINYLASNSEGLKIDHFDLSRGDEPYKFVYGGKAYSNYTFELGGLAT